MLNQQTSRVELLQFFAYSKARPQINQTSYFYRKIAFSKSSCQRFKNKGPSAGSGQSKGTANQCKTEALFFRVEPGRATRDLLE